MRKVFLEKLPHTQKGIDWENCIGSKVYFIYDDIEGEIKILSYCNANRSQVLYIEYENKVYKIYAQSFRNCKLSKLLKRKNKPFDYKYNIGDKITKNNNAFKILKRRYEKKNDKIIKFYEYECENCGYIGEKTEGAINKVCCDACSRFSKMVISGYNDIPTTNPWMIPYFQGGIEEAKLYKSNSNTKIYFKCPHCGKVSKNKKSPNGLYHNKGLGCSCSDGISYPNKFSYELLNQLPVTNVIHEYNPHWLKPYRYDNYFEFDGDKYILEMDGNLGHGNFKWGNIKDIEGTNRDEIKDKLAKENGLIVIRIDCKYSNLNYIKNSIEESILSKLFDLSKINWNRCNEYATKNLVKDICEYYNNNPNITPENIAKIFYISSRTVRNYLKCGTELGWCKYNTRRKGNYENN